MGAAKTGRTMMKPLRKLTLKLLLPAAVYTLFCLPSAHIFPALSLVPRAGASVLLQNDDAGGDKHENAVMIYIKYDPLGAAGICLAVAAALFVLIVGPANLLGAILNTPGPRSHELFRRFRGNAPAETFEDVLSDELKDLSAPK